MVIDSLDMKLQPLNLHAIIVSEKIDHILKKLGENYIGSIKNRRRWRNTVIKL